MDDASGSLSSSAPPVLAALVAAADGVFPPVDGVVEVVPSWRADLAAVVSFTGHAWICTSLPSDELAGLEFDGFGSALDPSLLLHLAGPGGVVGVIDQTFVARGRGSGAAVPLLPRPELAGHPRVQHALAIRDRVEILGDERGLVTLGRGLAGRLELSIEVQSPGRGAGRSLLADALRHVPDGDPVFAAVAPGNARSTRLFLAAGFVPIGSEVIISRPVE